MGQSEEDELRRGLARGGRRAAFHLAMAAIEVLKGVEALLEELSAATRHAQTGGTNEPGGPERIPLE